MPLSGAYLLRMARYCLELRTSGAEVKSEVDVPLARRPWNDSDLQGRSTSLLGEKPGGPRIANDTLRVVHTSAIFAFSLAVHGPPGFSLTRERR
jgi:hypothetical protein